MADQRPRPATPRKGDWRHKPSAASTSGSGPTGRGKKMFAVLAVMLALGGVVVGLMFWIGTFHPPAYLSLPITEYNDRRFPPNPFADLDGKALHRLINGDGSELASNSQENDLLRQKLKSLSNRNERVLVLHISSLAVCRESKVFLLPADADADRPETWLPLSEVLQAVQACPTKRKLLILDIMKPMAEPRLGVVRNEIAERVAQAVHDMGELTFWVYCACSPGQVSLVSEDLRQSVFGYYLMLGVRGKADNHGPTAKPDGRVTVKELAHYVTATVDQWAVANRAARQTPMLLGAGEDFELALAEKGLDPALDDPPDSYPAPLQDGWKQRDDWLRNGGLRQGPHVMRTLEGMLLWAEGRWRAGFDLDLVRKNPITDLRRYQDQMAQTGSGEAPRSRSLALAVAASKPDPFDPAVDELKDLANDAEQAAKAKEPAPARQEVLKKLDPWAKKLEKTPLLIAEAAFLAALADPKMEKVRFLDEVVSRIQPQRQFAETVLLQRLAVEDSKKWPTDLVAVRRALRMTRSREQVVGGDPAALPWIMNTLEAARAGQREAETLLFSGDPEKQKRGATLLEEAERRYALCEHAMDDLRKSLQLLDEAMAFLPGCALYLASRPMPSAGDDQSWLEAMYACRRLHRLLANPPLPQAGAAASPRDEPALLAAIQREDTMLRDRVQILGKPFQTKSVEQLLVQSGKPDAAPATLLELHALLASPLPPADTRASLWKASRSLSRQLHDRMVAADADKEHPPAPVPSYSDVDRQRLEGAERERAASRAALSIGLLHVGGMDVAEAFEKERKNMLQTPADADWNALGDKLRIAWGRDVPARMKTLLDQGDLAEATCLVRVAGPLDPVVSAPVRLSAEWRKRQTDAAWRWLGEFYRQEARSFLDGSSSSDFYRRAGDEYLQFAH